jgi:ABC-type glycerol-3-phosphate transport system substrate-binding protein
MEKLSRRQALRGIGAVSLAFGFGALLTACGGSSNTTSSTTTSGTSSSSAPSPAPNSQAPAATAPANVQPAGAAVQPTPIPASIIVATPGSTPIAADAGAPPPDLIAKPPKSAQPITLRFHMRTGGDKSEAAIYVYRPGEWMQQTGNKVTLEPIPGDANYFPKIISLAAAGTIGDLTWTSDVQAGHTHLVVANVLEPVDSYMASYKISKDEWVKAITDSLTYNGKMYGMPKTGHPGACYVWINLDMFKKAGIPEPPVYGNTWDDLHSWAVKLTKGPADRRDVYGFFYDINPGDIQGITDGVRSFGGDILSPDGTKALIDQQPFKDWLQWMYQMIVVDKVHPLGESVPSGGVVSLFAAQKLAMVNNQRSFHFQARNAVKDAFQMKVIQLPRGPKAMGWLSAIDTHSVTAASKYKDEAFTLTYALADKRFAYLVGKFNGYLTGRIDNLDDLGPYASDPFLQLQQKCTTQEERGMWRPKNLREPEIETALFNNLDTIWLGKSQPDSTFISGLQQAVTDILAKPQ